MNKSIFTKIINGEVPCHKIYEDDLTFAFLDISPLSEGHTIIVPKDQIDHIWDLDDALYQHLMAVAKKVAQRIREVLNPERVGIIVEGFAVAHAHIHVVPMDSGLEQMVGNKIPAPTDKQLAAVAAKLRF